MQTRTSLGWIGTGRMGYEMAARLAKGGCDVSVWNRTKAKAEPLAKHGATIANELKDLSSRDIVFVMVSTWDDVKDVVAKLLAGTAKPKMVVECSSISLEGSAELRQLLADKKIEYLAAPVSGNAKVIKAGMVFAVETYCPAADGISAARIEEEVILTPSGAKIISLYPAEELPIANPY